MAGNIRELKNLIDNTLVLIETDFVTPRIEAMGDGHTAQTGTGVMVSRLNRIDHFHPYTEHQFLLQSFRLFQDGF